MTNFLMLHDQLHVERLLRKNSNPKVKSGRWRVQNVTNTKEKLNSKQDIYALLFLHSIAKITITKDAQQKHISSEFHCVPDYIYSIREA